MGQGLRAFGLLWVGASLFLLGAGLFTSSPTSKNLYFLLGGITGLVAVGFLVLGSLWKK